MLEHIPLFQIRINPEERTRTRFREKCMQTNMSLLSYHKNSKKKNTTTTTCDQICRVTLRHWCTIDTVGSLPNSSPMSYFRASSCRLRLGGMGWKHEFFRLLVNLVDWLLTGHKQKWTLPCFPWHLGWSAFHEGASKKGSYTFAKWNEMEDLQTGRGIHHLLVLRLFGNLKSDNGLIDQSGTSGTPSDLFSWVF